MGRPIPYRIVERRPGDIAACYSDPSKSQSRTRMEVESTSPKCVKTHGVGKASIQMDLKTKMMISIIVPCLNEEEVLPFFISFGSSAS